MSVAGAVPVPDNNVTHYCTSQRKQIGASDASRTVVGASLTDDKIQSLQGTGRGGVNLARPNDH